MAVLAWSVSNWWELIRLARQTYTTAPLWDYWRIVANIPRYARFDLSVLWEQHNEHRIIFPELAMAADYLLLSGRALLPLTLDFGFLWMTLAVYGWAIWNHPDAKLRWFVILFGCGLAGWPGMALYFDHPFLVQWLFVQIGVVVALAALPRSVWIAIAAGVVANYSAANGLLIWPILILAAVALQLARRQIVNLTMAGTLFSGLYFAGYHPGPNLRIALLFQQPVFAMKWAAAYLSLPFGFASADAGLQFGFAGMLLLLTLIILSFRRIQPPTVIFLGAALFVAGSAVLATAGRMSIDRAVPSTDLDLRFVSMPLWFWLSLLFGAAFTIRDWTKWNWWISLPVALLMAVKLSATSEWITARLPEFQKNQLAALALETGVLDGPILSDTLYYDPEFVERAEGNLRSRKLSVFASRRFERMGKPAASIFPLNEVAQVPAEAIAASVVEGGMKLSGPIKEGTNDIVVVNQNGIVVGLGGRQGGGWAAFANLEIPSKSLRVYRVEGGRLSPMGAPVAVAEAIPIPYWRMGQFITGLHWDATGAFTPNGVSPELGGQPYGIVYGNWSSKGRGPGLLVSQTFDAPPGNCVVVPVGHGSPVTGETIEVVDGSTQAHIATIPISIADLTWRLWRVDLPAGTRTLKITADDQASGATQWIGLAQPARCASSYK